MASDRRATPASVLALAVRLDSPSRGGNSLVAATTSPQVGRRFGPVGDAVVVLGVCVGFSAGRTAATRGIGSRSANGSDASAEAVAPGVGTRGVSRSTTGANVSGSTTIAPGAVSICSSGRDAGAAEGRAAWAIDCVFNAGGESAVAGSTAATRGGSGANGAPSPEIGTGSGSVTAAWSPARTWPRSKAGGSGFGTSSSLASGAAVGSGSFAAGSAGPGSGSGSVSVAALATAGAMRPRECRAACARSPRRRRHGPFSQHRTSLWSFDLRPAAWRGRGLADSFGGGGRRQVFLVHTAGGTYRSWLVARFAFSSIGSRSETRLTREAAAARVRRGGLRAR